MLSLRVVVEGEPSTAHRPRYSGASRSGRPIMRSDSGFRTWKTMCGYAAARARKRWEREHGAAWPTEGWRYAVSCRGYLRADRKDADSVGRGFLDGCEGILWRNDRACRPVILDCAVGSPPRLEVDVLAYDPAVGLVDVQITYREGGA